MYMNSDDIKVEELRILKEFHNFCKKNCLKYSLYCGTLLGAIRHKGFIPWDDDIDVAMPRPDYEKFKMLFPKYRDGAIICIGQGYYYDTRPYIKVINKSIVVEEEGADNKHPMYLWIDVFPIDGLPDDEGQVRRYFNYINVYKRLLQLNDVKWSKKTKFSKNILYSIVGIVAKLIGKKYCYNKIESIIKKFPYGISKKIGMASWPEPAHRKALPKEIFDSIIEIAFENDYFDAIEEYDFYLSTIYGDYMILPPESQRQAHGIKAQRIEADERREY